MASAMPSAPIGAARDMIRSGSGRELVEAGARVARLGLSQRQQQLNYLWAFYRAAQYDTRAVEWNGDKRAVGLELEQIVQQGYMPPGFQDAGGQTLPLKFRRPTAPYHLCRLVVDRFTSLLFSEKRHPIVRVAGDQLTEDWFAGYLEATRFWAQMIQARAYGGSQGTACVGFQFRGGRPIIEVHDPRWLFPTWKDRAELTLSRLEKRYIYPVEERDEETGGFVEVAYWYRRVIDEDEDTVWAPVRVEDGEEPEWKHLPVNSVRHGFGFCPAYWTQNLPVQDDVDGDPDCHGAYDTFEEIDALTAQACRALKANGDPTVVVSTDAGLTELRKGNDNAIVIPSSGSAIYLEINGESISKMFEQADNLERRALQTCQCVLERPDAAGAKTATEVDRLWSSMLAKADILREQYGAKLIVPLLDGVRAAVRKLGAARVVGDGPDRKVERFAVRLPPKVLPSKGDVPGKVVERQLGLSDTSSSLQWPKYLEPNLDEVEGAVRAATSAKAAKLVDAARAVQLVAQYFEIEDVQGVLDQIRKEQAEQQDSEDEAAMAKMRAEAGKSGWGDAPAITQGEIDDGVFSIDEIRASKGYPVRGDDDGRLTVPEYRAKYPERFAMATVVENAATAEQILGMSPPAPAGSPDDGDDEQPDRGPPPDQG